MRKNLTEITMKQLLVLVFWMVVVAADAEMRAGIGVRTVTPEPLLPVIGGVGPAQKVMGKKGELTVRALVLSEGEERVAIVSADFLGFPGPLCDKARAAVKGIAPEKILIGATHTHSAPDTYGFPNGEKPTSYDSNYVAHVCRQMADAINEAAANLKPVVLRIGTGEAKGKIAYNAYASELFDPRCSVIQALDASGKPFFTLLNYAVHPEVLGADSGVCSPDLIGPLYDEIQAKGGGIGIFMNGAQGGMVTADNRLPNGKEARTWEECQRIGRLLASEALRIASEAKNQPEAKLLCRARKIVLPVDSPEIRNLLKVLPIYAGRANDTVTTQLNVINVGTAQILTIPGEALPNVGALLKRKMRGQHNLLFGLTNDAFGYILAREDYDSFPRYAYITRTSLGERTAPILESEALELIEQTTRP